MSSTAVVQSTSSDGPDDDDDTQTERQRQLVSARLSARQFLMTDKPGRITRFKRAKYREISHRKKQREVGKSSEPISVHELGGILADIVDQVIDSKFQ